MATTQALTLRDDNAVATRHSQVTEVQRLGGLLAASGYFADAREMAQAAVKVLAGEELGIPPVAAMMGINLIKGKIALSGNLIASRIRAHGYDYRHKQFDSKGCVLEFLGKADADGKRTVLGDSSFTEEDAKTAQCFTDMYKKYPRNMYFNRAISNGAKWYTPEVFAGAPVYVPEELGAKIDAQGDFVAEEPTPQDQKKAQQEVLNRKLAEIREQAPQVATDIVLPPPSALDEVLATFTRLEPITAAFAELKVSFLRTLDEGVWDAILTEHQCNDARFGGKIGNAKKCFTAMWRALEKACDEAEHAQ